MFCCLQKALPILSGSCRTHSPACPRHQLSQPPPRALSPGLGLVGSWLGHPQSGHPDMGCPSPLARGSDCQAGTSTCSGALVFLRRVFIPIRKNHLMGELSF